MGRTKARAEVHRDGDWHRAVHVWVYGVRNTGPFMLFQRRGLSKDTNPGGLDATVGGHYSAGESLEDVMREVQEEIGVPADIGAMRHIGVRVCASEKDGGPIDRELQDVYIWRRDDPLDAYAPNPYELEGLIEASLAGVLAMYSGHQELLTARFLQSGSNQVTTQTFGRDLFRTRIDRYPYRVAIAIRATIRGDEHISV